MPWNLLTLTHFKSESSSKSKTPLVKIPLNLIINMEADMTMEIKDNTFARQFETLADQGLVSVEYSFQEKKIFLTKINTPESFDDEEFISTFLKNIMGIAIERKFKVVPILPKIVVFFKKNSVYKELLPPGIRL